MIRTQPEMRSKTLDLPRSHPAPARPSTFFVGGLATGDQAGRKDTKNNTELFSLSITFVTLCLGGMK